MRARLYLMTTAEMIALDRYRIRARREVCKVVRDRLDVEREPMGWVGPDWEAAEALEQELMVAHALYEGPDGQQQLTALGERICAAAREKHARKARRIVYG